jgi:hypothetical protein
MEHKWNNFRSNKVSSFLNSVRSEERGTRVGAMRFKAEQYTE